MIIKTGTLKEFNVIKFYDRETITKTRNLNKENVILPDKWQEEIIDKYGYTKAYFVQVRGIELNENIRNARKLNIEKNDVFSLSEYDKSSRGKEKILYIPAKLETQGTTRKMESKKGYWLYEKNLVNFPIVVNVELWKEITKEQADNYCKEWGGTRNGTKLVKRLDDGRYVCMDTIEVTFPYFSLLTYKESVKSDYGQRLETMVKTIKEKAGIHIDEYSLEKLLEVYDITPKKQED